MRLFAASDSRRASGAAKPDVAARLYTCERNRWAEEARAYNGLIEFWREIIKIRDTLPDETTPGAEHTSASSAPLR